MSLTPSASVGRILRLRRLHACVRYCSAPLYHMQAAYLAKAGKKVVVLERRHVLGGAAVTEEIVPGRCAFRVYK